LNVRSTAEKAEGWLTTPLTDFTAVKPDERTVNFRPGSGMVSGVVPGNSLLSLVLRGTSAKK
jgi:hypothetical protein